MALTGWRGDELEIQVPCKAQYVRTIRRTVAEFAQFHHMTSADVEEMEIAASEAVSNVVRHAYSDRICLPPVRVRCLHSKGAITVEVSDDGRGFCAPPGNTIPQIDLDREGGLGIILIKTLMDRVRLVSKPNEGTKLSMTKRMRRGLRPVA
jgi:serine/threonine-protein kinase RsbW